MLRRSITIAATALCLASALPAFAAEETVKTTTRPAVRELRQSATGERHVRAVLRKKKASYTGGVVERVAELKFHRQERREKRKAARGE